MEVIDGMSKTAKIVAGVASAVVGLTCLAAWAQTRGGAGNNKDKSDKAVGKKKDKQAKKSGKKKGKKSSSSSSSSKKAPTRELALEIEHEVVQEFKAYMPHLGQQEERMRQQLDASGRQLDEAADQEIRQQLVDMMSAHLDKFNKALLEKHGVSPKQQDKVVQALLAAEDPEALRLQDESEKLWGMISGAAQPGDVPEHMDEETTINYICESFKLVIAAMQDAQAHFERDGEGVGAFRARMQADQALAAAFNGKFRDLLDVKKKKLQETYRIDESQVAAIVAAHQGSPNFAARVGAAKQEMDEYFRRQ
jgi:hypothetical protein